MKRIYLRVSTKSGRQLNGLDTQKRHAHLYGFHDSQIYIDINENGESFNNRPEYKRMIEDAQPGDKIYVLRADRFGRNVYKCIDEYRRIEELTGNPVMVLDTIDHLPFEPDIVSRTLEDQKNALYYKKLVFNAFFEAEKDQLKRKEESKKGIQNMKRDANGNRYSTKTGNYHGRPSVVNSKQFRAFFNSYPDVKQGLLDKRSHKDEMRQSWDIDEKTYNNYEHIYESYLKFYQTYPDVLNGCLNKDVHKHQMFKIGIDAKRYEAFEMLYEEKNY